MSPSPGGDRPVILVLGSTSGIARVTCRILAREGHDLFLAGRNQDEIERQAKDLQIRHGIHCESFRFDALEPDGHRALVRNAFARAEGRLEGVLVAFGTLGDEERARSDPEHAREIMEVNLLGVVSALTPIANRLEERGHGFIAVLSSVAGDRGRQSNYTYGAAKGGLSRWLEGLRNRLHGSGVQVTTVKPGPVDTPMTYGMKKGLLMADSKRVAEGIVRAVRKGRSVVYLPWFWRYIMLVIRLIPEPLYKRLNL